MRQRICAKMTQKTVTLRDEAASRPLMGKRNAASREGKNEIEQNNDNAGEFRSGLTGMHK
jgi:hypothetical protein